MLASVAEKEPVKEDLGGMANAHEDRSESPQLYDHVRRSKYILMMEIMNSEAAYIFQLRTRRVY